MASHFQKKCSSPICKNVNPQSIMNFDKNKSMKDGHANQCKSCSKISAKKYSDCDEVRKKKAKAQAKFRKENPEKTKEYKARQKLANPIKFKERNRDWSLRNKYGITLDIYKKMLESQDSKCKICGKTRNESKRNLNKDLVVDHCHKSGKVRGLLCIECNLGIGYFDDNIILFLKAIDYLKETNG